MRNIAIMATSAASGKDTVANLIQVMMNEKEGVQYVNSPLGGELHAICNQMFFRKHDKSECFGRVPRRFLQGTAEFMRNTFGEDVWINLNDLNINEQNTKGYGAIVTDMRKVIEYAHYCVESDFLPLYVKVSPEVARERLLKRDGCFNVSEMTNDLETQMRFLETLPAIPVGANGLKNIRVGDDSHLNNIFIIDNSGDISSTKKQIFDWWECVNERG